MGERFWGPVAVFMATAAFIVSLIAVVRAGENGGGTAPGLAGVGAGAGGEGGAATVPISEGEFWIKPDPAEAPPGPVVLTVTNEGAIPHTLALKGSDKVTKEIPAGEQASLDLGTLKAGDYTLICTIPGHEAAGMKSTLVVKEGAAAAGVAGQMSGDEIDRATKESIAKFPAKTEGKGGQVMEPDVQADGTKQYVLTASEFDWEVEPGKTVKAWGYNGVVPGPTIRVSTGDKLRVILKNELPESTSIHFHGLMTPNAMDGVPDVTQPPTKRGESFTYEFVAKGPAVGIYHAHQDSQKQVPMGLLGAIYVGDLPVPGGVAVSQRIPLVLNDAGNIGFSLNGKSFPATEPIVATKGEWIQIDYMNEGLQIHPMHLHGQTQLVIGKDGYAIPQPYQGDTILIAPGERVSVLVMADEPGTWLFHCHILTHAESERGYFGMATAFIVKEG